MRTRIGTAIVLGLGIATWQCGGTTFTGSSDASTDATSDSSHGDGSAVDGGGVDVGADSPATCSPACGPGRQCCGGTCKNLDNDPENCGGCGIKCGGSTPYCDGSCKPTPCEKDGSACSNGICCGTTCCAPGDICCKGEGPRSGPPQCFTPTPQEPTCPQGCAPQCVSDRDAKTDVAPIDGQRVLDALARVPMSTWTYKDDPNVRHIGPMAQDLHSAGLSGSATSYDPIDAHGIAFTSIQALYAMVKEQNARIEKLEKENARLRDVCR